MNNIPYVFLRQLTNLFESVLHALSDNPKYFIRRPLSPTQCILKTYSDGSIDIALCMTCEKEILPEVKKWIPDLLAYSSQSLVAMVEEMADTFINVQKKYF